MIWIALYFVGGLLVTLLRVWLLRRMGVRLLAFMSPFTWFFTVLIWPVDLVASGWRYLRLRPLLRRGKP